MGVSGSQRFLKHRYHIANLAGLILCLLVNTSCLEQGTKSSIDDFNIGVKSDLIDGTKTKVYYQKPSNEELYLGELVVADGEIEFPNYLKSGLYGDRISSDSSVDFLLSVRIFNDSASPVTGDYYFETPIYQDLLVVNSAASALYWFIKNNFSSGTSENLKVSKKLWSKLLSSLEVYCQKCSSYSSTYTINKLSNSSLQDQVFSLLVTENPNMERSLVASIEQYPWVAFSALGAVANQSLDLTADEGTQKKLEVLFFHLSDSNRKHYANFWEHSFLSVVVDTRYESYYNANFSFSDSGNHTLNVKFSDGSLQSTSLNIDFSVGDVNIAPNLASIPAQSFQVNHEKVIDLSSYLSDADGDTSLSLVLYDGPSGVLASGTDLVWNPTSLQLGSFVVKLQAMDSKGAKSQVVSVNVSTTADSLPSFVSTPTLVMVNEGIEAYIEIEATDLDGDSLEIVPADTTAVLENELPANAGWASSATLITDNSNNRTFRFYILPSYLQLINQSSSDIVIDFLLSYDNSVPGLRDVTAITQSHTIRITNQDDPPAWQLQPLNVSVTEQLAFSLNPLSDGAVADNVLNPSTLSYSLETQNSTFCSGVSINSSTGIVSGTLGYLSLAQCQYRITAKDANLLTSASSWFTLNVTNSNRLPSITGPLAPSYTIAEGELFTLNLNDYFSDPDSNEGDAREELAFTCSNCLALNLDLVVQNSGMISWSAPYNHAGVYSNVRIEFTDKYMRENAITPLYQEFDLTITQAPAPIKYLGLASLYEMEENELGEIKFDIEAFSGDGIDAYNYNLSLICTNCGNGMVKLATGSESGNSTSPTEHTIEITTNYESGNSSLKYKIYSLKLHAEKADDPNVKSEVTVQLKVKNKNRAPTGLAFKFSNVEDTNPTAYPLDIDLSIGSNRFKTYTVDLRAIDPDSTFDTFIYTFTDTDNFPSVGTISGAKWTYIPLGCSAAGGTNFSKTVKIRATDSEGLYWDREMLINFKDTLASEICP